MTKEQVKTPLLKLSILPHRKAPILSRATDAQEVLEQLSREVRSKSVGSSKEVWNLLREAGLVNLWFFLKYLAGFSGPFNELTQRLDLELCNERQAEWCMAPGSKSAFFLPRGHHKTTDLSIGADGWEVLRNPDIRIRICNAVIQRAQDFVRTVRNIFDANDVIRWLYPEWCPVPGTERWNEKEFVMRNRTRTFKEPTLKPGGAEGSSEGDHHDLLNLDDIEGLDDLDSEMRASASMAQKKKWFRTNTRSLLVSWKQSRIVATGTFYSADDVYCEEIISRAKRFIGRQVPWADTNAKGEWNVYWREALEEGKVIFPENYTKEGLERLMEEDWWTYSTQMANNPIGAGTAEFWGTEVGICSCYFDTRIDKYVIQPEGIDMVTGKEYEIVLLEDCDIVMSVDPAASKKGTGSKTCRTSIGVWAKDAKERLFRLWEKVGFLGIVEVFDAIFEGYQRFEGAVRAVIVEKNGFQKVLEPLLQEEQSRRGVWIPLMMDEVRTEKDARIRTTVGNALVRKKVWLARGAEVNFLGEMKSFPGVENRKDVLDESEKAIRILITPSSSEERAERRRYERDELYRIASSNAFGY